MLARIPRLHDDELLYSWVARMGVRLRPRHRQDLMRLLWGDENRRSKVDMPLRLENLAKKAEGIIGDGRSLLLKATLFPLYALVLPQVRREALADGMIDAAGVGSSRVTGLNALRLRTPPSMRFCPECWREDDAGKIERYWRRSHQCPGVLVCHFHQRALHYSEALWAAREAVQQFFPAAQVKESKGREIRLSKAEMGACLDVAVSSHWLLNDNRAFPGPERLAEAYKEVFYDLGLVRPSGMICPDLIQFVTGKVGPTLMKLATQSQGWSREWPVLMMRQSQVDRCSHSPLKHLLLMSAAGHRAESFLAALNKPTLLEQALKQAKAQRSFVKVSKPSPACQARAAEIAGWWNDPSLSVSEMARRLGVAAGTVTLHASRSGLPFPRKGLLGDTWAKFAAPVPRDREAERDSQRRAFLEYRSRFPKMSQTEMLKLGKPGVRWLQKHDREWLRAHRCRDTRKGGAPGVNWEKRDVILAQKVARLVAKSSQERKSLSISAIGRRLGICLVNIHHRLPLTSRVLSHMRSKANRHSLQ